MSMVNVTIIGCVILLLAFARPLCAQWSPLAPLSGGGAIGSPGGTHPVVADGKTVHAVWAQGGNIHYRRSTNSGVTWGDAIQVTSGETAFYTCSLELSGSTLHLLWPDSRNGTWEVYYKRSTDGGNTWGSDTRLTHGVDLFRLGTASSDSTVHVAWSNRSLVLQEPTGTHTWGEIYYKRSTDGGATWGPDVRLTLPDASAVRPSIAASGKYVHLAWIDRRESTEEWDWDVDVYYKRSTDGGATWGPDVRMSQSPWMASHSQIVATPQGRVCYVWEDGSFYDGTKFVGDKALYASVSEDNGKTWTKPQRITFINAPNGWATHSKSYAYKSRMHLAWADAPESGSRSAYYMTSPDGGLTWEEPERLTLASQGSFYAEGVGGTESYAIVLMYESGILYYRRRDIAEDSPPGDPDRDKR